MCRVRVAQDRQGGIIRFGTAAEAAKALSDFESKPEGEQLVAGLKATLAKVEGDAEKEFHQRVSRARGRGLAAQGRS